MRGLRVTIVCLFLSTTTLADTITTSQPFLGVTLYSITQTSPRPNNIRIVEIDLTIPGLSFRSSSRDPNLPNGDETITQSTRQFTDEQSAQLAINTTFFRLDNGLQALPTNNVGLLVSDGDPISPWDATNEVGINLTSANIAQLITAPSSRPTGFETSPTVPLFNAVRGSNRLLNNATNVAPADSTTPGAFLNLNPRTAMGYTVTSKLLLATIDGRRSGFSEGMYLREVADLLKGYGATEAINLDGGGSTTMTLDYYGDGATRSQLVNTPSGSERHVGASLAVFAPKNPTFTAPNPVVVPAPPGNIKLLDDFEDSDTHFYNDPDFSGSNRGLKELSDGNGPSRAERDANQMGRAFASKRIDIISEDDPTWDGFRLRYLSGQGNPANNEHLGTSGYVGFMMRTTTPDLLVSIGLDENLGSAIESGTPIALIADGMWHLYQWNLADAAQWDNFTSAANGQIDGPVTTIDSIIISSPQDHDATVWLDAIGYNPDGPLTNIPEPAVSLGAVTLFLLGSGRRR
jgi:hypothetical protein